MKIHEFDELDSTMKYMRQNIEKFNEFDIVSVKNQTGGNGKGRNGNFFLLSEGMAIFTFLVKERENLNYIEYLKLPLLVALAVVKGLKLSEDLNYMIKWTNDIYLYDKKICGILIEREQNNFYVGIGININNEIQKEIENVAVSLNGITGKKYDIKEIILNIVSEFKKIYTEFISGNWPYQLKEINKINYLKNKKINIKISDSIVGGIVQNIDYSGKLEVLVNGTIKSFSIGEIIKERVIVGYSGSVESFICAYLLKEQAYDVILVSVIDKNDINIEEAAKILKLKYEKLTGNFYSLLNMLKKYNAKYIGLGKNNPCFNTDVELLVPLAKYSDDEIKKIKKKLFINDNVDFLKK